MLKFAYYIDKKYENNKIAYTNNGKNNRFDYDT